MTGYFTDLLETRSSTGWGLVDAKDCCYFAATRVFIDILSARQHRRVDRMGLPAAVSGLQKCGQADSASSVGKMEPCCWPRVILCLEWVKLQCMRQQDVAKCELSRYREDLGDLELHLTRAAVLG